MNNLFPDALRARHIWGVAFLLCLPALPGLLKPLQAQRNFPVTVQSCGMDVTLQAPAQRIFVVNSHETISLLSSLDALDCVVALTPKPMADIYSEAEYQQFEQILLISPTDSSTGHSDIPTEVIVNSRPDLVLASEVDRKLLASAGIAVYSQPALCNSIHFERGDSPSGKEMGSFESVYQQLEIYGRMLGLPRKAAREIRKLKATVPKLPRSPQVGSAVALYVARSKQLWA